MDLKAAVHSLKEALPLEEGLGMKTRSMDLAAQTKSWVLYGQLKPDPQQYANYRYMWVC